MKKVLSLVLVLALAMSMLCTAAFAEGSKTELFTPSKTDLLGTVAIETVESTLEAVTSDEMAAALAEVEDVDVAVEDLTIVSQCDFTAEEYPVVVKFFGEGTEDVTICMFVKYENADKWTLLYHGLAGEWEVEFEAAGTYAIAVLVD